MTWMVVVDLFSLGVMPRRTCNRWLICSKCCKCIFTYERWWIYMSFGWYGFIFNSVMLRRTCDRCLICFSGYWCILLHL
jgi:hypothetical protein